MTHRCRQDRLVRYAIVARYREAQPFSQVFDGDPATALDPGQRVPECRRKITLGFDDDDRINVDAMNPQSFDNPIDFRRAAKNGQATRNAP